jgi:hypothetical protein
MQERFTTETKALICFLYDGGLDAGDIVERRGWPDDWFHDVQNVIDEWVQACDDTERPFEPGDFAPEEN